MQIEADTGSFRDPINRVYDFVCDDENAAKSSPVYRGLHQSALENYRALRSADFFKNLIANRSIVETEECPGGDAYALIAREGWDGVLCHERIPFISYPYEWSFTMMKDAALLHLDIVEQALENGWTLKDATPYNVQWVKARPIFIDIPSFEPRAPGEPWNGYRQFTAMFLTPLLLHAHLGIDYAPVLRSCLDGIPAPEAIKYFRGLDRLKRGVLSHIVLPAQVENAIAKKERGNAAVKKRTGLNHSDAMVVGLIQSLRRLIRSLNINAQHTDWSYYDQTHSYFEAELDAKKEFVARNARLARHKSIWDIGCNTGTFSILVAPYADQILSLDGDHDAIEQLYCREKKAGSGKILPLVMDLANISPNQGWDGKERLSLESRNRPSLVLCLALIHHMRLSANIPNKSFLSWLRSLGAAIIIEFVDRHDEMVVKMLKNKKEQYDDYNAEQFESDCCVFFDIKDRQKLKGGKREIFYLTPKQYSGK